MSLELENQIKDALFKERVFKTVIKFKKYLISFLFLIIVLPSAYHIYADYKYKKNLNLMSQYSDAMLLLNNNKIDQSIIIFEKLVKNRENETIKLLAINKLLEIYIKKKNFQKAINIINIEIDNIKISENTKNLLKIKKSLLIFDQINENEILILLDVKNQNNIYRNINIKIISDYYLSKNKKEKYQKFINDIK